MLKISKTFKYLGVTLDNDLNMQENIRKVVYAGQNLCNRLSKIRYLIDTDIAYAIVKTYIIPTLEYGLIFSSLATKHTQLNISKVLNRALRTVQKADRYKHNIDLYKDANMLPISYRLKYYSAGVDEARCLPFKSRPQTDLKFLFLVQ